MMTWAPTPPYFPRFNLLLDSLVIRASFYSPSTFSILHSAVDSLNRRP